MPARRHEFRASVHAGGHPDGRPGADAFAGTMAGPSRSTQRRRTCGRSSHPGSRSRRWTTRPRTIGSPPLAGMLPVQLVVLVGHFDASGTDEMPIRVPRLQRAVHRGRDRLGRRVAGAAPIRARPRAPRRRSDRRPSSAGRDPGATSRAPASSCPWTTRASGETVHRSARSITTRSAGAPSTSPTDPLRRDRPASTRAGPVVSASMARSSGSRPASTAASSMPIAVSMPLIPFAADPNSTALSTSVCGAWSRGDGVGRAVGERGQDRGGVLRRAQRRVDPQRRIEWPSGDRPIGPRIAVGVPRPAPGARDPLVGERQVMRRDVAGDRQAGGLGPADELERTGRRDMGQVQPGARHVADDIGEDREVARDRRLLGGIGPALEAQHGRDEPVVRLGATGEGAVLGVIDDRQPQRPGVGERGPQDRRRRHRRAVVAEPDDAGVGQLAERGERLPGPPGGHRPVREELDGRVRRDRGGPDPRQDGRLVERGGRVRHRADAS